MCRYCASYDDPECDLINLMNKNIDCGALDKISLSVYMDDGALTASFGEIPDKKYKATKAINYCPMCGRKLKKG